MSTIHIQDLQRTLIMHDILMTDFTDRQSPKSTHNDRRRNPRLMKQYKRPRGNPARSNRHMYTMKDMKSW